MITKQAVTAEQFWEMPEIPDKRFELVNGELVAVPSPGAMHNFVVAVLNHLLYAFVSSRRLGFVFGDNTSYLLHRGPDRVRIPDLSFIAWEHVPAEGLPDGFWSVVPDLAVEVVSPSDRTSDVLSKADEYLASGTRLVWVVWLKDRAVTVHIKGETRRELGANDVLDGGDMLPGFNVRVSELFDIPTRP